MCYLPGRRRAKVYLETVDGEAAKNIIDAKVASAPADHILKQTVLTQNSRNKDKYNWVIENTEDKSEDNLIKWYVESLVAFYEFMESAVVEVKEAKEAIDAAAIAKAEAEKAEAEAKAAKAVAEAKAAAEKAKADAAAAQKAAEEEMKKLKEEAEKAKAKAEKEAAKAKAEAEAAIKAAAEEAKKAAKEAEDAAKKAKAAPKATKSSNDEGALPGVFTLKDGKKIRFSQGNLQFNPKKYEFRFAKEQYETLGKEANGKCAPNYDGWIDIFGWGTSGYMGCQPTESDLNEKDYGPTSGDLTGDNANYDWGVYNPITNGGNKEGLWRTPTPEEIEYLLEERPNAEKLKLNCRVCGVAGFIIMPDDFWSIRLRFPIEVSSTDWNDNQFDKDQWEFLESVGVVFIPYSYCKYFDSSSSSKGWLDNYWTRFWTTRKAILVYGDYLYTPDYCYKAPVRLGKDVK
jgi:hypothetical protein